MDGVFELLRPPKPLLFPYLSGPVEERVPVSPASVTPAGSHSGNPEQRGALPGGDP